MNKPIFVQVTKFNKQKKTTVMERFFDDRKEFNNYYDRMKKEPNAIIQVMFYDPRVETRNAVMYEHVLRHDIPAVIWSKK